MARSALATQTVVDTGLNPVFTAANVDGHSIDGNGDVICEVVNDSAVSVNVTVVTGGTLVGKAVVDTVVAVPAGQRRHIGRFRSDLYNQPAGPDKDRVLVDFSAVVSVTIAALKV